MRTFIAIELPPQVKNKLSELQTRLAKSNADVKWVKPENIHLTLKFLGEIDEDKSVKIAGIIQNIISSLKQFTIQLSSLGAFPKVEFPRVIWVAINKGDKEVKMIAKELEDNLDKLGDSKEERPFSTHITIGRVRSPLNKDKLIKALKESENYLAGDNIEFCAAKITLFKSTLGQTGPTYEVLKEVNITTA
jgi:RNA 2',3'-cyclic 3'-phosphodiesterase